MTGTSLAQAAHWMAAIMGLDPVRDHDEVVEFVNRYRMLLFNSYQETQLFDEFEQCFQIQTFRQECSGNACPTYRGFTATLDMEGIVGAWESLDPVSTRSRWREVLRGKSNHSGPDLELIPVNGRFATERDMTSSARIHLYAHNKGDAGKVVTVVAMDENREKHTMQVTLRDDTHAYVNEIVCRIVSVSLPVDLCGAVSLYQEGNYLLSTYPKGVPLPQYKRYKINDNDCTSGYVLVQSAQKYIPITEGHEVVELGNQMIIEEAGKYFKYGHSTLDSKEQKAADGYLRKMYALVEGYKSRSRGKEKNDTHVNFVKTPRRRRGLPGHRTRRR